MTHTRTYSIFHRALLKGAHEFGVEPMIARIAVAVYERNGDARTDDLALDIGDAGGGSSVRRAVGRMYRLGLAAGFGVDGDRRRTGVRTRVTLTQSGRALAGRVLTLHELAKSKAA